MFFIFLLYSSIRLVKTTRTSIIVGLFRGGATVGLAGRLAPSGLGLYSFFSIPPPIPLVAILALYYLFHGLGLQS